MSNEIIINPVSEYQRLQIVEATNSCVEKAGGIFSRHFSLLTIDFDLRGKCAGMYQVRGKKRRIRTLRCQQQGNSVAGIHDLRKNCLVQHQ
jgi:hypothetical protein